MTGTFAPKMLDKRLQQPEFVDFYLPFGGKLKKENRWVRLAQKVPWEIVEECYKESLTDSAMGAPSISSRIAYGSLIIKERLGVSDEETLDQLCESPYLQYFVGLSEYLDEALFDPSMMVHFRSRFTQEHHRKINDAIIARAIEDAKQEGSNDDDQEPPTHQGKLLVDASCTPAGITYPTDLKLLNEAREKTESYIDIMYDSLKKRGVAPKRKPRTYRQEARKKYLSLAKQKRPSKSKRRSAIRKQLNYVRRNLKSVDQLVKIETGVLGELSRYEYKCLLVIHTLHEQQRYMFENRVNKIGDRIVSISQPHVRPIVRGKAASKVEFGAKVSISCLAEGYVSLDRLSWDAYNEGNDLIEQIKGYRDRFGYYPESVHADRIYQNRENRKFCKDIGIRLAGKPLGRPRKQTEENKHELEAQKQQRRQDELDRIPVEGKFGNSKRKGTLQRIMAKLSHTSESVIHVGFVVLNLDKWLRQELFVLISMVTGEVFSKITNLLENFRWANCPKSTFS